MEELIWIYINRLYCFIKIDMLREHVYFLCENTIFSHGIHCLFILRTLKRFILRLLLVLDKGDIMDKSFYAFGTMNFIRIDSEMDYTHTESVLNQVVNICNELDDRFSVFKLESDITKINRSAGKRAVKVHPTTIELIQKSLYYSEISSGAFDITIGSAMNMWGFGSDKQQRPTEKQVKAVKKLVNYKSIRINESKGSVLLLEKGQKIDLGGVVKGYACDRIKQYLEYKNIKSGILNFGGSVMTIGEKNSESPWRVGVQNPLKERGESIGVVLLKDEAMVTSGINERYFEEQGIRYHHLLDTKTLFPVKTGVLSVTVTNGPGLILDIMATTLFVMGVEKGIPLAEQVGVEALFLLEDGKMYATQGFKDGKYRLQELHSKIGA